MNIPFWSPAREYAKHKDEVLGAIDACLGRGELILGYLQEIETFEKTFADFIGTRYAVMCGSGTQALHLAYRALGLKGNWNYLWRKVIAGELTQEEAEAQFEGDEVITTSHTFIATIDQIVAVGAKPVLVDIGDDGLIDPAEIEKAITPRTRAIVPVHLEGKVCDMGAIWSIAKQNNLLIIEDAAQAIGAEWSWTEGNAEAELVLSKKAGSFGDAGCFSLYPAKVFGSVGNAGIVTTNEESLAEQLRMLRCNYNIGRKSKDIDNAEYGHNFEPDAIQAAVLNVKFKYLEPRLRARREVAMLYDANFDELPLILPTKQPYRVYQDYTLRARTAEERAQIVKVLREKGVGVIGDDLTPNHHYKKLLLTPSLPKTEEHLATQFRIPCNPDLTSEEVAYIIKSVIEACSTVKES